MLKTEWIIQEGELHLSLLEISYYNIRTGVIYDIILYIHKQFTIYNNTVRISKEGFVPYQGRVGDVEWVTDCK